MIVVDTSALMAILLGEPEALQFSVALIGADEAVIGAPTAFECLLASRRKLGAAGVAEMQLVLERSRLRVTNWSERLLPLATQALAKYGKGQHPACLNFGDCMSYAVARDLNAPLLYKGNDFALTDIRPALDQPG